MPIYIVCQKKRNNPRMDIRICQKKCDLKDECEEYISHQKLLDQGQELAATGEPRPFPMDPAYHPAGQ